ncbi:DUF2637 domain-containing protein [Nocardia sp. NBC_00881]|uniref:DUF2637 domain-containing protein n=1 Tax=Nocardia sp. NBC_00881 TaxID=2975995 RepID=UPI0038630703|nr:DUF2637 domain-containing protein [Nocardia sp. NBC_00881]
MTATATATDQPTTDLHTALPESTARKPRAHAFVWTVLGAAATVSITGNATQALLHDTALPAVAAAVAIIPPLALLAAVHGVSVLLRAHAGARATHLIATAMTALIATGAFWLSFTALRSLAVTAGVPHGEAWLWPLIIEGSMAQSTVALLALAHSATHSDSGTATADHQPSEQLCTAPAPPLTQDQSQATPESGYVHTPSPTVDRSDRGFRELAVLLCARDPARRRDPEVVAQALATTTSTGGLPPESPASSTKAGRRSAECSATPQQSEIRTHSPMSQPHEVDLTSTALRTTPLPHRTSLFLRSSNWSSNERALSTRT